MNRKFIKMKLVELDKTQKDLAEMIPTNEGKHMTASALSNILTGVTDPRKSTIDKIAKALGVEAKDII